MDLVSVIVPIYNVQEYLDMCVKSIVEQTYKNLEIILVDDGSPDKCGEMCDCWAQKDDRIRVIHKPNGGLSDARNFGLDICKGRYITFVDSDDYIAQDYVEYMMGNIGDADICLCNYIAFTENIQKVPSFIEKDEVLSQDQYWASVFTKDSTQYAIVAWNKLYKRELWNNVRFPKGKVHEDRFVSSEIIKQCNKIVFLKKPLYYYRYRYGSITTQKIIRGMIDDLDAFREQLNYLISTNNKKCLLMAVNDLFDRNYKLINDIFNSPSASVSERKLIMLNVQKISDEYRKYYQGKVSIIMRFKMLMLRYATSISLVYARTREFVMKSKNYIVRKVVR